MVAGIFQCQPLQGNLKDTAGRHAADRRSTGRSPAAEDAAIDTATPAMAVAKGQDTQLQQTRAKAEPLPAWTLPALPGVMSVPFLCGLGSAMVGVVVLVGWALDIESFKRL